MILQMWKLSKLRSEVELSEIAKEELNAYYGVLGDRYTENILSVSFNKRCPMTAEFFMKIPRFGPVTIIVPSGHRSENSGAQHCNCMGAILVTQKLFLSLIRLRFGLRVQTRSGILA